MYWERGTKPLGPCCGKPAESPKPVKTESPKPVKKPVKTKPAEKSRFRIDWPELKRITLRLLAGDGSDFKNSSNRNQALGYVSGGNWEGFTRGQLERWLTEGFKTDAIKGLEDFIPPIREKRKFVFSEEGDEFHFDIAASGGENYMSHITKRDEIPGLAIHADIGFQAGVKTEILNQYYVWLCRVAFAVESSGIDTEITLDYSDVSSMFGYGNSEKTDTVIRVKRENEATDFLSWSAMLSPASFRSLMFIANTLHAESKGIPISSGQGRQDGGDWNIEFRSEDRTLRITCPYMAREFPETKMTEMLRKALREATTNTK